MSSLLNAVHGFLGEHLKLHILATTNAPLRELDPALLRPGRLMGMRQFRRLTRPEAQRLAEAKGLTLAGKRLVHENVISATGRARVGPRS